MRAQVVRRAGNSAAGATEVGARAHIHSSLPHMAVSEADSPSTSYCASGAAKLVNSCRRHMCPIPSPPARPRAARATHATATTSGVGGGRLLPPTRRLTAWRRQPRAACSGPLPHMHALCSLSVIETGVRERVFASGPCPRVAVPLPLPLPLPLRAVAVERRSEWDGACPEVPRASRYDVEEPFS
jgi:hypothetical protein